MAESHVLSGLVAKRAELAGLIEFKQNEIKRMQDDIRHLDAAIKLFDPDYDLKGIKSKTHRKQCRFFSNGECYRMVLDTLRKSGGSAETPAITTMIMAEKGLNETDRKMISLSILKSLDTARKRGIVTSTSHPGSSSLWTLVS